MRVEMGQGNDNICHESNLNIGNVIPNVDTVNVETQLSIAQLNEIMIEGRNVDGISFKRLT